MLQFLLLPLQARDCILLPSRSATAGQFNDEEKAGLLRRTNKVWKAFERIKDIHNIQCVRLSYQTSRHAPVKWYYDL